MRHLLLILVCLMPGAAFACALPPSIILTLPTGHYITAAALTVAFTVAMGLWVDRLPKLGSNTLYEGRVLIPEVVSSYLSLLVFLGLVFIGIFGSRDPMHNLLTLVFWTGVWIVVPLASMIVGNIWQAINPWTAAVRITRSLLGRNTSIGLARFGAWPAVLGLAGFSWFEMVSLSPEDPFVLAKAAVTYWVVIYLLAVLEGEAWLQQGEFLTLMMRLLAKVAPLWIESDGQRMALKAGWPGSQILTMQPLTLSEMAFLAALLASLSFDGFMDTYVWLAWIGENPLEPTGRSAVVWPNTLGLAASWGITALTLWAVIRAGRLPAGPVMLSFLAIAAGYHAAHYFVTLLTAGQYTLAALNDPFFRGDSYLGLDDFFVSFGFLTDGGLMPLIYAVQFAAILGAHILAVLLSLRLAGEVRAVSHLPLAVLMVGYTVLGLWLLSTARSG